MEAKEKNEMETKYQVDSFVDTVWEQYEAGVTRARKQLQDTEDAYLNAFGAVRKWVGEQRGNFESYVRDMTKKSHDLLNLQESQLETVAEKLESLAWTPVKFTLDLIEQAEKRIEENSKEFVKFQRERRNAWNQLADEYSQTVKNNQRAFLRALEDSVRPFVGAER